jgi:hypothetical protein
MHQKMDIALRELNEATAALQEEPKFAPICTALQKLSEGLEQEFRDLHREDERLKERIKNSKP